MELEVILLIILLVVNGLMLGVIFMAMIMIAAFSDSLGTLRSHHKGFEDRMVKFEARAKQREMDLAVEMALYKKKGRK